MKIDKWDSYFLRKKYKIIKCLYTTEEATGAPNDFFNQDKLTVSLTKRKQNKKNGKKIICSAMALPSVSQTLPLVNNNSPFRISVLFIPLCFLRRRLEVEAVRAAQRSIYILWQSKGRGCFERSI
jgi:hypothetical protein